MANKVVHRYSLNKEKLIDLLDRRGMSINKLGKDETFPYTSRSVSRAFKGGASFNLMYNLSTYLGVKFSDLV